MMAIIFFVEVAQSLVTTLSHGPKNILAATHNEFNLLLTDSATFLTDAVRQFGGWGARLNSAFASSIGTTQEIVFWELWSLVAVTCNFETILPTWPKFWSEDNQPLQLSWYTAFHNLLTWLLAFSNSSAWLLNAKTWLEL